MSTEDDAVQVQGSECGPKRYPIRCVECGKSEVRPAVVSQTVRRNHDGRVYDLAVEGLQVTKCDACGEVYFTQESDDRITAALREHLSLLTPEQIRENLVVLGMTQKEAAMRLGVAAETMCRWLSGSVVQSRAMDNLLRAFFACPEVRAGLSGNGGTLAGFGVRVERVS